MKRERMAVCERVVCPRDPGSNLSADKLFSDSVRVGFEFKFIGH
jgi:hypothetical protein